MLYFFFGFLVFGLLCCWPNYNLRLESLFNNVLCHWFLCHQLIHLLLADKIYKTKNERRVSHRITIKHREYKNCSSEISEDDCATWNEIFQQPAFITQSFCKSVLICQRLYVNIYEDYYKYRCMDILYSY